MPTTPADLTIGLTDGTFYGGDPFPAFAWMRANAPAYFDEAAGVWGISRYADVREISKDPDTFSNAGGIRPDSDALPMMIDFDAPEHVRRRRLVSEGFTPRRIRESEEGIRIICDAIIDRVCEQGTADFVRDIAAPLPMIVIGNMLGVAPEDRADLLRWSDDMLRALGSPDPTAMDLAAQASVEYAGYITAVVEQRRRDHQTNDLIGTLVHAEIDGDRLDESSLIYESLLILIGGDETTRHVISGGMYELLVHPDQYRRLAAERTMLPTAIEEMLRWVTPIKNMARTATRDVELHGETVRSGPEAPPPLPVRQPGRDGLRGPRVLRHHQDPQRPRCLRVRLPLLPRQPAGPDGAAGHVLSSCSTVCPTWPWPIPPSRRSGRPTSCPGTRPCR